MCYTVYIKRKQKEGNMSQLFIGACDGCSRLGTVGFETTSEGLAFCLECSGLCDCGCTELGDEEPTRNIHAADFGYFGDC